MNAKLFSRIINNRLRICKGVLQYKGGVYANSSDRLSNFKDAGRLLGCSPEQALRGFMTKHLVALFDFIDTLDTDHEMLNMAEWGEKIGDSINYLLLLEGLVNDRLKAGAGKPPLTPPTTKTTTEGKSVDTSSVEKALTKDKLPAHTTSGTILEPSVLLPEYKDGDTVRVLEVHNNDGWSYKREELEGKTGKLIGSVTRSASEELARQGYLAASILLEDEDHPSAYGFINIKLGR